MTKTPSEIYKKFAVVDAKVIADNTTGLNRDAELLENINVMCKNLTLAILEAELERLEERIKDDEQEELEDWDEGFNAAFSNHATFIKEQIKEIQGI